MIKGIGIDLIETARFSDQKNSQEFLAQIFTPDEIDAVKKNPLLLTIKFTLKEAILKALGIGLYFGFFWRNIELQNNCEIKIKGRLEEFYPDAGVVHITNDKTKKYVVGIALIEEKRRFENV